MILQLVVLVHIGSVVTWINDASDHRDCCCCFRRRNDWWNYQTLRILKPLQQLLSARQVTILFSCNGFSFG